MNGNNIHTIHEHDIAALLNALPDKPLVAGDIGTVVLVHGRGEAVEVEFPNPAGKPRYYCGHGASEEFAQTAQH